MNELDPSVTVTPFDTRTAWRQRADIVHVHWPEMCVEAESTVRAAAKTTWVLITLGIHRARRARFVWTCHNLRSHEQKHPRIERAMRRVFDRWIDGVIHPTEESAASAAVALPHLGQTRSCVIPLPQPGHHEVAAPSRSAARAALGLAADTPVLGFTGYIRPYKNVPALIDAFQDMTTPAHLLVAGNPVDAALKASIENAAHDRPDIMLDLRWLSEEELVTRVCAADAIVLPYTDIHNSGAAISALSLGRPIAVPAIGSMPALAQLAGPAWVHLLDGPISGSSLDEVLQWSRQERPDAPDLSALDLDEVTTKTLAFYREILVRPATRSAAI